MIVKGEKRYKPTRVVDAFHEKDGVNKKERGRLAMIALLFIIINFASLQKIISLFF